MDKIFEETLVFMYIISILFETRFMATVIV